jgi:hypothetical protein
LGAGGLTRAYLNAAINVIKWGWWINNA